MESFINPPNALADWRAQHVHSSDLLCGDHMTSKTTKQKEKIMVLEKCGHCGMEYHRLHKHKCDKGRIAKMHSLVIELCSAIHQYRFAHDNYGGDDLRTGRAWDLMRRTQEKAQASLDPMGQLIASVETPDPFNKPPTRFT